MRRLWIDDHLDFARGDVGDLAVKSQLHGRLIPDIVDEPVDTGMTGAFQTATHHPFVEPLEPTKTAAALQVDQFRMHDFLNRRAPPEKDVARGNGQHTHAAGRTNAELQFAVVHEDDIDTFLPSPVKAHFSNRASLRASNDVTGRQFPFIDVQVIPHTRERFSIGSLGAAGVRIYGR